MDKEHDRLFNVHWWAGALRQRRELDVTEHSGDRVHQKVDPDGHELHGPDHVLTEWERAWLTERINDTLRDRLLTRQEHAPVLDEPLEEHEARELAARARDYFGASHDETREKFQKLHAEHTSRRNSAAAHHKNASPEEREHWHTLLVGHDTALEQIDSYIAPGAGLVDRHIATVKVEVGEKRRIAQQHIDDCAKVLEVPYADVVAEYLARVEAELRALAPTE